MLSLCSDDTNHHEPIINHVLLILALHLHSSRNKRRLNIMHFINNIKEPKKSKTNINYSKLIINLLSNYFYLGECWGGEWFRDCIYV